MTSVPRATESDPTATAGAALAAADAPLGGSERARHAGLAILALSRAARAFLLYDPENDAIRRFIEDLRAKMTRALAGADAMRLELRPFDMLLEGETVYHELDREHSLAFRLYRDGVRRLTIAAAVDWQELLRLLEVLSIRYTGVRQNEDDVVTLLWKAGFQHIEIEAVEGFEPEDEADAGRRARADVGSQVPDDWDLPARALPEPVAVVWRDVAEADRAALLAEEASHFLATNAAQAAATLIARAADPTEPLSFEEVTHFVAEVRDFLLAEGQLEHLITLVRLLLLHVAEGAQAMASLVATFGDRRALTQILHSTPKTQTVPPPELLELLDLLPQDRLSRLIEVLVDERGEASRRLARQLVERYAPDDPELVVRRMQAGPPPVSCDLLRALAGVLPDRALDLALEFAHHTDAALVSEALRRLETAPSSPKVARTLVRMLDSPHEDTRPKVLELLAERIGAGAFDALRRWTEARAPRGLPPDEADAIGRTLARMAPAVALDAFREWLRSKGLVGRWVETQAQVSLQWTAVCGLGNLRVAEAEQVIRDFSTRAGGDLRRHCLATLARRRHARTLYG